MNRDEIRVGDRLRYHPIATFSWGIPVNEVVEVVGVMRKMVRVRLASGEVTRVYPRNLFPIKEQH